MLCNIWHDLQQFVFFFFLYYATFCLWSVEKKIAKLVNLDFLFHNSFQSLFKIKRSFQIQFIYLSSHPQEFFIYRIFLLCGSLEPVGSSLIGSSLKCLYAFSYIFVKQTETSMIFFSLLFGDVIFFLNLTLYKLIFLRLNAYWALVSESSIF